MGVLGFLCAGFFGTALLDAAVSSKATADGSTQAAGSLSSAFSVLERAISIVVDPSHPAIPNPAGYLPGVSSSSSSSPPVLTPGSASSSPVKAPRGAHPSTQGASNG